jgi:hypothetical protein
MRNKTNVFHKLEGLSKGEILPTDQLAFVCLVDGFDYSLELVVFKELLDCIFVIVNEGISVGVKDFCIFVGVRLMNEIGNEIIVFLLFESCEYLIKVLEMDSFYLFILHNFRY